MMKEYFQGGTWIDLPYTDSTEDDDEDEDEVVNMKKDKKFLGLSIRRGIGFNCNNWYRICCYFTNDELFSSIYLLIWRKNKGKLLN